jgi:hypothetical protein
MPWAGLEPTIPATNRPRPTPQTARPLWPADGHPTSHKIHSFARGFLPVWDPTLCFLPQAHVPLAANRQGRLHSGIVSLLCAMVLIFTPADISVFRLIATVVSCTGNSDTFISVSRLSDYGLESHHRLFSGINVISLAALSLLPCAPNLCCQIQIYETEPVTINYTVIFIIRLCYTKTNQF